jgi:hypothetical protein
MQSVKDAVPYIRDVWTAIGPLLGVFVGAFLTRSWDKKKWMNDNRKEEYRELMSSLTEAATAMMKRWYPATINTVTREEVQMSSDKYLLALKVIKTRIFIANDMKEMNLFDRFGEAVHTMIANESVDTFEEVYETLRDEIVARATR